MKKKTKIILGIIAGIIIIAGVVGYLIYDSLQNIDIEKLTAGLTTDLTEEQRANPISKYYHKEPTKPAENILNDLEEALSADKMISPENLDYFLDSNNTCYNGYGVLENGVAYAATETIMYGVSGDMYNFYEAWSSAQNDRELIYKIWYPGYHYTQTESMILVEDIGQGEEVIQFIQSKADYSQELVEQNNLDMYVISARIIPVNGGDELKSILMHVRFENEDGNYVDRCIAWFGCYWKNGKVVEDLTGLENAMERAKGMAYHSAGENANLASVILEVYADEKDNFDPSTVNTKKGGRDGKGK